MEERLRELRHHGASIQGVKGAHCHVMVAEAAKKAAAAFYEEAAKRSNLFFHANPSQDAFVAKSWGLFVKMGRAALANALQSKTLPEEGKEMIMEALLLDSTLMRGRQGGIQVR